MRRLALALLVSVAAAGCGGGDEGAGEGAPAGQTGQTIEIVETDFALDPSTVGVEEAGTYTFQIVNRGQTEHALQIKGEGVDEESETIGPGESTELTVELEGGDYEMYCPVDGHKGLGMEGDVVVAGGGPTGTGETETESDDGY